MHFFQIHGFYPNNFTVNVNRLFSLPLSHQQMSQDPFTQITPNSCLQLGYVINCWMKNSCITQRQNYALRKRSTSWRYDFPFGFKTSEHPSVPQPKTTAQPQSPRAPRPAGLLSAAGLRAFSRSQRTLGSYRETGCKLQAPRYRPARGTRPLSAPVLVREKEQKMQHYFRAAVARRAEP